jgi:hypothetical protein
MHHERTTSPNEAHTTSMREEVQEKARSCLGSWTGRRANQSFESEEQGYCTYFPPPGCFLRYLILIMPQQQGSYRHADAL